MRKEINKNVQITQFKLHTRIVYCADFVISKSAKQKKEFDVWFLYLDRDRIYFKRKISQAMEKEKQIGHLGRHAITTTRQRREGTSTLNTMAANEDTNVECPLCMEPIELDDINFFPCACGYQICRFCWHRIRTDENGLCPACRKQYPEDPADFKPLTQDELQKIKSEKRQKDLQRKQKLSANRKHLADVRKAPSPTPTQAVSLTASNDAWPSLHSGSSNSTQTGNSKDIPRNVNNKQQSKETRNRNLSSDDDCGTVNCRSKEKSSTPPINPNTTANSSTATTNPTTDPRQQQQQQQHQQQQPTTQIQQQQNLFIDDNVDSNSFFTSGNGFLQRTRNYSPPTPTPTSGSDWLSDALPLITAETLPVRSSTNWQVTSGLARQQYSKDHNLRFDPWNESSKALGDLMEKESMSDRSGYAITNGCFGFPTVAGSDTSTELIGAMSANEDTNVECPLCMESFERDDINFFPCTCGYQICRFCWHRSRADEDGLCPACRKQYPEDPADFKPLTQEELQKIKGDKRQKDLQRKQKLSENRKQLANIRVVQKNLVFVVGLSQRLAISEALNGHEYFGKFGKIHKVDINLSTSYAGSQGTSDSACAYVTYNRSEDALRAIETVNNIYVDGRTLKASLGATKYCSHFLGCQQCPKPDCMYLHELGDEAASFTKEEMQQGKHHEYERKLHEQLFNSSCPPTVEKKEQNRKAPSPTPTQAVSLTASNDPWPSLHSGSSKSTQSGNSKDILRNVNNKQQSKETRNRNLSSDDDCGTVNCRSKEKSSTPPINSEDLTVEIGQFQNYSSPKVEDSERQSYTRDFLLGRQPTAALFPTGSTSVKKPKTSLTGDEDKRRRTIKRGAESNRLVSSEPSRKSFKSNSSKCPGKALSKSTGSEYKASVERKTSETKPPCTSFHKMSPSTKTTAKPDEHDKHYGKIPDHASTFFRGYEFITLPSSLSRDSQLDAHYFRQRLNQQITRAKGTVITHVSNETWWRIVGRRENEEKFFVVSITYSTCDLFQRALLTAVPCVSHTWVIACCQQSQFVDYRKYLLAVGFSKVDGVVKQWHGARFIFKNSVFGVRGKSSKENTKNIEFLLTLGGACVKPNFLSGEYLDFQLSSIYIIELRVVKSKPSIQNIFPEMWLWESLILGYKISPDQWDRFTRKRERKETTQKSRGIRCSSLK